MSRKTKIHTILKGNIIELLNKIYDLKLYYKYTFHHRTFKDREKQEALLFKLYHIVEKGLSLPQPRPGFGKEKIYEMLNVASSYLAEFGENELTNSIASCLNQYLDFNKRNSFELGKDLQQQIETFIDSNSSNSTNGGILDITRVHIMNSINSDFETFFNNRFSIRNFENTKVSEELIEKAVEIARKTPSVCNRQAWITHLYTDKNQIDLLLKLQNGNRGFDSSINSLIVMTSNIKSFTYYEGNQVFIDGGMFSMSLILALHSQGIGTCALNTCRPYWYEKKIKVIGNIPSNERIIMMIAVGAIKEEFKIAISNRKPVTQLLKKHY